LSDSSRVLSRKIHWKIKQMENGKLGGNNS
jgi:hypothetical protein